MITQDTKRRSSALKKACSLCLTMFIIFPIYGQNGKLSIEERYCVCSNCYSGKKLIIHYSTDTGEVVSDLGYWLGPFIRLPDSIKIRIITKLLEFKNDTSQCCLKVIERDFNGIEGCGGKPDGVDRYNIQIDALFMINRICWPHSMELFSCVPVLFDLKKKVVINDNPVKIAILFEFYCEWFKKVKESGVIPKPFPFNGGRYVWYHGRKWIEEK